MCQPKLSLKIISINKKMTTNENEKEIETEKKNKNAK